MFEIEDREDGKTVIWIDGKAILLYRQDALILPFKLKEYFNLS